ncbi:MAG: YicC/YloC family endoribonuclease [Chloroherpetonaceae bacterium]|nr:YicC/YloC family endoribonuclease [Chloroherpetonaceae bacterium]
MTPQSLYMIESMTGYGFAEKTNGNTTFSAEIRSVNSRFSEINLKLPRVLSSREIEAKEIIRKQLLRGKISASLQITKTDGENIPLRLKSDTVRGYIHLLRDLKQASGIEEEIRLDHLLKFTDIFESDIGEEEEESLWHLGETVLEEAIKNLREMRRKEGIELGKDFETRIESINQTLLKIESLSKQTIEETREKIRQKVREILTDETKISRDRLELEVVLIADKMDITEECVRFRSHNKFFIEALRNAEPSGRKLNFLLQEQNREANTIASKSQNSEIAQLVVFLKEELEKIREQVQNIE